VELHVYEGWRVRTAVAATLGDMILLAPNRFDQGGDLEDLIGCVQDVSRVGLGTGAPWGRSCTHMVMLASYMDMTAISCQSTSL
jgi:hypothetical protein